MKKLTIAIIVLILAGIIFGLSGCGDDVNENGLTPQQIIWNNGYCSECGGKYWFSGATRTSMRFYYFYTCEDCDHTIYLHEIME